MVFKRAGLFQSGPDSFKTGSTALKHVQWFFKIINDSFKGDPDGFPTYMYVELPMGIQCADCSV